MSKPALIFSMLVAQAAGVSAAESLLPAEMRVSEDRARLEMRRLQAEATAPAPLPGASLLPPENRVSEREARLTLARLLGGILARSGEALREYDWLIKENADDPGQRRERLGVLLRLRQWDRAAADLAILLKIRPRDPQLLADMGDVEAARGHAVQSRDFYQRALSSGGHSRDLSLRYARQMRGWGDFQEAAQRFRKALAATPSTALEYELAETYVGAQEYERAERIYRRLLPQARARIGVAEIRLREKDYAAAQAEAEAALGVSPDNAAALGVSARALRALGRDNEARAVSRRLPRRSGHDDSSAHGLTAAADLKASDGHFDEAIALYDKALARDAAYFAAHLGQAEALAASHRYDEALAKLDDLQRQLPGNSKLALTTARVLSWARRYDDSIAAYRALRAEDPDNVVPVREMARVAAWAKQMDLAQATYRELWQRPLDARLAAELPMRDERPYAAYEALLHSAGSPARQRLLEESYADYRLQKSAWLEAHGKLHAWHIHFLRAEDTLQELLAFTPGNEEALFDLAQAQAAQDLHARAVETYGTLLRLDPIHNLAAQALERERVLASPMADARYFYWDEKGAGRNSDITRHQFTLGGELVWNWQHRARAFSGFWLEEPGFGRGSATAIGGGLEFEDVWNEYVRTSAQWQHKSYTAPDLDDSDAFRASATFNALDLAHLSIGVSRQQEIPNGFALRQNVHITAAELGLMANPHRHLEIRGAASFLSYSDSNQGFWAWLAPGVILHDHPHTLKLVFRGDYRDTDEESSNVFRDGRFDQDGITDIRHPYWTPQNYCRGQLILEWRHDLARDYYAGALQHFYALRAGIETDSTKNDGWRAEAEWRWDFAQAWSVQAFGTIERTRQWDGQSVLLSISRRFP